MFPILWCNTHFWNKHVHFCAHVWIPLMETIVEVQLVGQKKCISMVICYETDIQIDCSNLHYINKKCLFLNNTTNAKIFSIVLSIFLWLPVKCLFICSLAFVISLLWTHFSCYLSVIFFSLICSHSSNIMPNNSLSTI